MIFDDKVFKHECPDVLKSVLEIVWSHGFIPTIVGGLVRDFFIDQKVGDDWDIELVHPTIAFSRTHWKDFGKSLDKIGRVSYLPFEIIRLEVKGKEFEFSPPRKETFQNDWEKHGHKNFTADFDYRLSDSEARARRDFTVNSIGLRWKSDNSIEVIDPLLGLQDLQLKELRPCGENFHKDPVRFLRSYRFKVKLGFSLSTELKNILSTMPIDQISSHYVWEEMKKSKSPVRFLRELIESGRNLGLPVDESAVAIWAKPEFKGLNPTRHEDWVVALEFSEISSENWTRYFNVGGENLRRLIRWAKSSRQFSDIHPEMLQGDFEEIRVTPVFDSLYEWYFTTKQLLQKDSSLPLLNLVEHCLPEWIHLFRFETVKDLGHIDPPLRSSYQLWNLCQRL